MTRIPQAPDLREDLAEASAVLAEAQGLRPDAADYEMAKRLRAQLLEWARSQTPPEIGPEFEAVRAAVNVPALITAMVALAAVRDRGGSDA